MSWNVKALLDLLLSLTLSCTPLPTELMPAYLASYLTLLDPKEQGLGSLGYWWYERVPSYRLGGEITKSLFEPAQRIDELLRPQYWRGKIPADTSELDIPLKSVRHAD